MNTFDFSLPYKLENNSNFFVQAREMLEHHLKFNQSYEKAVSNFKLTEINSLEGLPFLHVGLFKHLNLTTVYNDSKIKEFHSSSTSGIASKIYSDEITSSLQALSSQEILSDYIGKNQRKLLILDSSKSLRTRTMSARIMAAMSLKPFSNSIHFLLSEPNDLSSFNFSSFEKILTEAEVDETILIYGFSWILWSTFFKNSFPDSILQLMKKVNFIFIHSGGWKKLENEKVTTEEFQSFFRSLSSEKSFVLDYYGLVEQMGIIFPECSYGYRHVPHWSEVIIRDSWSLKPLINKTGQIQLLNNISFSSPTHSILTEDLGLIVPGPCLCGRNGTKFLLQGRIPKAELRGCSNV